MNRFRASSGLLTVAWSGLCALVVVAVAVAQEGSRPPRDEAFAAFQREDYAAAAKAFEVALESADDGDAEFAYDLALSRWRAGDAEGAEIAAEKAAALSGGALAPLRDGLVGNLRYEAARAKLAEDPGAALELAQKAKSNFLRGARRARGDVRARLLRNLERVLRLIREIEDASEQESEDSEDGDEQQDGEGEQDDEQKDQESEPSDEGEDSESKDGESQDGESQDGESEDEGEPKPPDEGSEGESSEPESPQPEEPQGEPGEQPPEPQPEPGPEDEQPAEPQPGEDPEPPPTPEPGAEEEAPPKPEEGQEPPATEPDLDAMEPSDEPVKPPDADARQRQLTPEETKRLLEKLRQQMELKDRLREAQRRRRPPVERDW